MYVSKAAPAQSGPWHLSLLELVHELGSADDDGLVAARFQRFAEDTGFQNVVCVMLPRTGELTSDCVLMNTRPGAWSAEYLRRGYARCDPVLRELTMADRPFAWSDITERRPLTAREAAVMTFAAEFGMRDGFVVPIFESSNVGLVSLAAVGLQLEAGQKEALTLAAVLLHNRLLALKRRQLRPAARLTEREYEVMQWIAAGKSDWQIGKILNISAKTVNYHVENVKRKFAVASRVQAVVAVMLQGRSLL